jgi:hypothetical protein
MIVTRRAEPLNLNSIQLRERRHTTSLAFKFSPAAQHLTPELTRADEQHPT